MTRAMPVETSERKLLCGDPVRDGLRAIGWTGTGQGLAPSDFTEEERYRIFKAVLHGNAYPAAEVAGWDGRIVFTWSHSVWGWRHGGKRRFVERVKAAAEKELSSVDYGVYDVTPLRCLIGDDGRRFAIMLKAEDVGMMHQRMSGMEADLAVLDRKLETMHRERTAFGEVKYRIALYDNVFEAVIRGGKGGWLWTTIR